MNKNQKAFCEYPIEYFAAKCPLGKILWSGSIKIYG